MLIEGRLMIFDTIFDVTTLLPEGLDFWLSMKWLVLNLSILPSFGKINCCKKKDAIRRRAIVPLFVVANFFVEKMNSPNSF